MAGIIDGEGHITVTKSQYSEKYRKQHNVSANTWNFCINIGVKTTDERLLKWISNKFGGVIYSDKRQEANWKRAYSWRLLGQEKQERFLLAILPYLIIKREQAILALQFICMDGEENQTKRLDIHGQLQKLNRRGVSPTTNTPDTQNVKIESGLHGNMQSATEVIQ